MFDLFGTSLSDGDKLHLHNIKLAVDWDKTWHNVSNEEIGYMKELLAIFRTKTTDQDEIRQITELQQYVHTRTPLRER